MVSIHSCVHTPHSLTVSDGKTVTVHKISWDISKWVDSVYTGNFISNHIGQISSEISFVGELVFRLHDNVLFTLFRQPICQWNLGTPIYKSFLWTCSSSVFIGVCGDSCTHLIERTKSSWPDSCHQKYITTLLKWIMYISQGVYFDRQPKGHTWMLCRGIPYIFVFLAHTCSC